MSQINQTTNISFIVPCYNYGKYLAECLNSIKNQSINNWECIVIDNGSTDNTREVAANFVNQDKRFQYHFTEQKGVSFARNLAVSLSVGQCLLPVDADDRIAPTYAEKAFQIISTKPQVKVVYSDAELFEGSTGKWILPEYSLKAMLTENSIFCSAMYRRSDFEKAGGYNEEMKEGFEDWDFWIRMLKDGGEVFKIPEVLFYYRIRASSRNSSLDYEKQLLLRKRIYQNHKALYDSLFNWPELLFNQYRTANELSGINQSAEYRLGKFLLKPLRALKKLFN
ncbi:MAG: glycosyltransferase [Bacteroidia bacterium]|nr:glycosyltransferase [Bacteroidia bacterium]